MLFQDRYDAGQQLAHALESYASDAGAVVVGLPRGGVPVAFQVAHALGLPLDILLVRKLGVPGQEEWAMGAIAGGGIRVLNDEVIDELAIDPDLVESVTAQEEAELTRREHAYRGNRPPLDVAGCTVLLIDDGLATGMTMRAAIRALRHRHPARIVVAVPVGSAETCDEMAVLVERLVCLKTPSPFRAVGRWYEDFSPTTDEEVCAILAGRDPRHPPNA